MKWTKALERELQAGIKKGFKPALSENKTVLGCNKTGCNHVAWECFSVQSIQLSGNMNDAGEATGTLLSEVYCSPEHQAERLATIDNFLMEEGS